MAQSHTLDLARAAAALSPGESEALAADAADVERFLKPAA